MTGKNKIVVVGLLAVLVAVIVKHLRLVRWLGIYAHANEQLTARVRELKDENASLEARKRGLVPIEEHPNFRNIFENFPVTDSESAERIVVMLQGFLNNPRPPLESEFGWKIKDIGDLLDAVGSMRKYLRANGLELICKRTSDELLLIRLCSKPCLVRPQHRS